MKQEEFPPVPTQLLWMFDAIDRKEATKMMHDYAKTCVTARLAKPLREAWERAQKAEDRANRLEAEREEIEIRIWNEAVEACSKRVYLALGADDSLKFIEGMLK